MNTYQPRPFREHAPLRQSKTARDIQSEIELMRRMSGRHGLNRRKPTFLAWYLIGAAIACAILIINAII